jgi:hypothetical protein
MEIEREKRKMEEAIYKSRAGDVATWITEIENRRKLNNQYGARLLHTNVTRQKINQEQARRQKDELAKDYHDELSIQLEEKLRQDQLIKLRENVAGIEHVKKWDDWVS